MPLSKEQRQEWYEACEKKGLEELEALWPNGKWYPDKFPAPSTKRYFLKDMIDLTKATVEMGEPLDSLWHEDENPQKCGVLIRAMKKHVKKRKTLTHAALSAAKNEVETQLDKWQQTNLGKVSVEAVNSINASTKTQANVEPDMTANSPVRANKAAPHKPRSGIEHGKSTRGNPDSPISAVSQYKIQDKIPSFKRGFPSSQNKPKTPGKRVTRAAALTIPTKVLTASKKRPTSDIASSAKRQRVGSKDLAALSNPHSSPGSSSPGSVFTGLSDVDFTVLNMTSLELPPHGTNDKNVVGDTNVVDLTDRRDSTFTSAMNRARANSLRASISRLKSNEMLTSEDLFFGFTHCLSPRDDWFIFDPGWQVEKPDHIIRKSLPRNLLFVLNQRTHWTLVHIDKEEHTINHYNSLKSQEMCFRLFNEQVECATGLKVTAMAMSEKVRASLLR